MSIYAIGDVQGCHHELLQFLTHVNFDTSSDHLYLVGDLVNRGPDSLGVLRTVRALGDSATCVLGNHDLHLLSLHAGVRKHRRGDTLKMLLQAPDCDELMDWLRRRPLLHLDKKRRIAVCHAGIHPAWSIKQARKLARETEACLEKKGYVKLLNIMYGNRPANWSESLAGPDRHRFIINAFTRMRYCNRSGSMIFRYNGTPGSQPTKLKPWYKLRKTDSLRYTIIFGHWSTLGARKVAGAICLDSGCVWGGPLTGIDLGQVKNRFIKIKNFGKT